VHDLSVIITLAGALAAALVFGAITQREVNPRITLIAVADSRAEHAWLQAFGANYVLDTADEMSQALLRAIRTAI
jgi:hypothetical protein